LEALSKLLHDKVVTNLQEVGERLLPGDPHLEMSVAVTEPAEDVEDQETVLHRPVKVVEGTG